MSAGETQNERTALAWQRTALSVVAGAAVLARLTLGRLGPLAVLGLFVALPIGLAVLGSSRRRYRDRLDPGAHAPSGLTPLALAAAVALLAVLELLALLLRP